MKGFCLMCGSTLVRGVCPECSLPRVKLCPNCKGWLYADRTHACWYADPPQWIPEIVRLREQQP